jgi:predicted membrane protein DUF2231
LPPTENGRLSHGCDSGGLPFVLEPSVIAAGIIGGLLALVFGLIDWWAIPSGTRAKAIGLWHGVGNVVVVLFVHR